MEGFLDYVRDEGLLHGRMEWLVAAIEAAAAIIDLVAIAVLLVGATRFLIGYLRAEFRRGEDERKRGLNAERVELGRYILAGLEILIVSDIIATAVSLAMADLVFLGILVVIRSVISFFLERELQTVERELGNGGGLTEKGGRR
ncbi:DUF1622 domain-containing protein [Paracoccus sp. Z118]|uniref:DUF1622 domain-containing protein n=1 Tax=Paracoccus sp. Z118 TaxID=2851017 RepID=UPI001C2BA3BC|nr:DUF1622 domain-containing protein [Paracoccus sp. Z118]MBV0892285.1 DUF1622 domain-containing protein [Paracoccus sp. Z118]